MDIVSRLKKFMNSQQVASSQFADNCGIPRPTISQILNGRNKKISDELIGKIHQAYPELSVLWLMFGEGSMTTDSNIETSEAQNGGISQFSEGQNAEHELFSGSTIDFNFVDKNQSEKNLDVFAGLTGQNKEDDAASAQPDQSASASETPSFKTRQQIDPLTQIVNSASQYKKITSIVVFYDDSTFQTFTPTQP